MLRLYRRVRYFSTIHTERVECIEPRGINVARTKADWQDHSQDIFFAYSVIVSQNAVICRVRGGEGCVTVIVLRHINR